MTDKRPSKLLDFVSLQYALLAKEHGSFRRAAQALDVRTSVVSRRVRSLEDAIGVSIFHRQSLGAEPTIAGARILDVGRIIMDEIDSLLRIASLSGSGERGRLTVGVASSIAGGKARETLRSFLADNPEIEFDVVEGTARDLAAAVRNVQVDVAITTGAPSAPNCEVEPLWAEQIMVALQSNHVLAQEPSLDLDKISKERFIVSTMDPGPEIQSYLDMRFAHYGRQPLVERKHVQRESLMALVGLGRGITIVCTNRAEISYPGVVLRPLMDEFVAFNAIWLSRNDNPVLRRFLSFARVQRRLEATRPEPHRALL